MSLRHAFSRVTIRPFSRSAIASSLRTENIRLQNEVLELEHQFRLTEKQKQMQEANKNKPPLTEEDYAEMYNDIKTIVAPEDIRKGQQVITTSLLQKLQISPPDGAESLQLAVTSKSGPAAQIRDLVIARTGELLDTSDMPLSMREINQVLRMLARLGRANDVSSWIAKAKERGLQPNVETFDQLIDAYAMAKDPGKALATLRSLPSPTVYSYANTIKAFVIAKRLKKSFDLYEEMKRLGLMPNLPIFTTLIKGCIDVNEHERAWKTFDHMRLEICQPDIVAYSLMIHSCAKTNNAERSMDLFEEMQSRNIKPNRVTFNSLINACARREDYFIQAFNVLREMQYQGHQPDKYTFNALIFACSKQGDIPRAKWLLSEMLRGAQADEALKPDSITMTNILWTYSAWVPPTNPVIPTLQTDAVNAMDAVYDNQPPPMKAEDWTFDLAPPKRINSVVKDLKALIDILTTKQDPLFSEVKLTTFLWNAYLSAVLKHQSINAGMEVFKSIAKPNAWTYKLILQKCYDDKLENIAEEMWKAWNSSRSFDISDIPHWQLAEIGNTREMEYMIVCLMINTLARCNNIDRAMNFLREYKSDTLPPKFVDLRTLYVKSIQLDRPDITQEMSRICSGIKGVRGSVIPGMTSTSKFRNVREKKKARFR